MGKKSYLKASEYMKRNKVEIGSPLLMGQVQYFFCGPAMSKWVKNLMYGFCIVGASIFFAQLDFISLFQFYSV